MLNEIHDTRSGLQMAPVIDPGIVDSKRLQMFYASVKEGSFAAAAQILSVSPSAISHAMKSLEEDFGCPLFRRFGPQVKPTGAAVRLMPMVEDMLLRMSSMKSELAALDGRSESLVFRLPPALMGLIPASVLSTFCECFPVADFEILLQGADLPVANRKGVDFDIDYIQRVPAGVVRRNLMDDELKAYVAPFHGLGQKSRISIQDLKRGLLVLPDQSTLERLANHVAGGLSGDLVKWILPDPRVAEELARQGQGIVFLPEWAAEAGVKEGALVCLKLPGLELHRTCCAWWDPDRPLTWVAEAFLSLLAAEIGADP